MQITEENKNKGLRYNNGKSQLHLIPPEVLFALANVLTKGAQKYTPRNWELGMKYSDVFSSLERHMWSWWHNENGGIDEESGQTHLEHALCNLAFLITYKEREIGIDDRPKIASNKLKKAIEVQQTVGMGVGISEAKISDHAITYNRLPTTT